MRMFGMDGVMLLVVVCDWYFDIVWMLLMG